MQGQRSTINSLVEAFELDHGSSSSSTEVEQQHFWNNMLNPESQLPDYFLPPNDASVTFSNPAGHDGRTLSGWSLGEPSSSENHAGNQIIHDDTKMEHVWPSSLSTRVGAGLRSEERQYEPNDVLSIESVNLNRTNNQVPNGQLFLPNSGTAIARNINLNAAYADTDGGQIMETGSSPHLFKPGGSETEQSSYAADSNNLFGAASGSGGYLAQESDGRPGCSLDGRRLSCKRKALEGVSGQLSLGGSSSCFQRAENSIWNSVPASYNAAGSSNISTSTDTPAVNPHEQLNPGHGIDMLLASDSPSAPNAATNVESSQRNFRMRVNPGHQQDRAASNLPLAGNSRHSHVLSPHHPSSRLLPSDHPLDLRQTATSSSTQTQSHVLHIPGLPRNLHLHPSPWYGASTSRSGTSSSSVIPGEVNSRNIPRNSSEQPMFVLAPETRAFSQDPATWNSTNGNMSIPGNVPSSSRVVSSSGVHPSTAPTWLPLHNPPAQHPRRLSEIRRSLFLATGSESGVQGRNAHSLRPGIPGSSQETPLSSGVSRQVHHQPYPRSGLRIDRQGSGTVEVPLSFRSLATAGEGRSRLVSEIRNALDVMRRGGEGLRFEDFVILEQSMFYGMPELHDRHRDMRLDVDNMSYEELLALEERIGNVSTGLTEEIILKCLKQRKYMSLGIGAPLEVEPCCICQEEYIDGEDVGRLDCGHDFHTACVKQWLTQKNLCPICKTTGLVT